MAVLAMLVSACELLVKLFLSLEDLGFELFLVSFLMIPHHL